MDLKALLTQELQRLTGFASPSARRIELVDPAAQRLTLDLLAVDSLSCSLEALLLQIPRLAGREATVIQDWADRLARRVTYLLEHVGPIETDTTTGTVLVRSNPPDRSASATRYYEMLLSAQANGTFALKRYQAESGQPGRQLVEMHLTREVLTRLVGDLIDTAP